MGGCTAGTGAAGIRQLAKLASRADLAQAFDVCTRFR